MLNYLTKFLNRKKPPQVASARRADVRDHVGKGHSMSLAVVGKDGQVNMKRVVFIAAGQGLISMSRVEEDQRVLFYCCGCNNQAIPIEREMFKHLVQFLPGKRG